jgi:hypothetical protein
VKWSAAEAAEVPLAVTTVTSTTVPAAPPGEVATQLVLDEQDATVPGLAPKLTEVAPGTNPDPVIVTVVAPATGPATGVTAVTVGARVTVWVASAEGPPLLETVWPVNVWAVEVPAVSVTVRVAVKGPEVV